MAKFIVFIVYGLTLLCGIHVVMNEPQDMW